MNGSIARIPFTRQFALIKGKKKSHTRIVGGVEAKLDGTDRDEETDTDGTPFSSHGRPS